MVKMNTIAGLVVLCMVSAVAAFFLPNAVGTVLSFVSIGAAAAIGVLAIVVLVSIGQGANSSVTASIEGMGTNLISATINARRTNPVTADGLNELAENEAIAYIAPLTNVSGTVKAGVNTYDDGTVQGTAPGYEHIRN